jgi:transcriptional regulator CtsR
MVAPLYSTVAWAEAVAVGDVMTAITGDQTDLEILPKPKVEAYSGRALRIGRVAVETGAFAGSPAATELNLLLAPVNAKADGAVARFVLESADPSKAKAWGRLTSEQGYELVVSEEGGVPSIRIKALAPAGLFYGIQTLKQLCIFKEGKLCIREGSIEDWPSIHWRGMKDAIPKLLAFYEPYKLNFGWNYLYDRDVFLAPNGADAAQRDARTPVEACQTHYKEIAVSFNPGPHDLTDDNLAAIEAAWERWRVAGVRKFVLSFDDVAPEKLSDQSRARFGTYPVAQSYYIKELDSWLHGRDAADQLYLCHQQYYGGNTAGDRSVTNLAKAGLPEDLQLCWTGNDCTMSKPLTPDDVAAYEKGFGRPATFLYHNWPDGTGSKTLCETGPLTPAQGPNASLAGKLDIYMMCTNEDRASEVAFLSGLDWAWNTEAYDPARSNRVVAREWARMFAAGDPSKAYAPLVAVMEWQRTHVITPWYWCSSDTPKMVPDQFKRKPEELARLVDEEAAFYARELPLLKANLKDTQLVSEMEKTTELRLKAFRQLVAVLSAPRSGKGP